MENSTITIIDYDMGNLGSVANMIKKIGGKTVISRDKKIIEKAGKLILPGVGAFDSGIRNLTKFDLIEVLTKKVIFQKTPILGICLGMQLFSKESEEGTLSGLSWINAKTIYFRFDKSANFRIPHMGWNDIDLRKKSILFKNMPKDLRFYFIHSYHVHCFNDADIVSTTNYGVDFVSAISHENIFGTQFHPEKSHQFGMQLMKNFLEFKC